MVLLHISHIIPPNLFQHSQTPKTPSIPSPFGKRFPSPIAYSQKYSILLQSIPQDRFTSLQKPIFRGIDCNFAKNVLLQGRKLINYFPANKKQVCPRNIFHFFENIFAKKISLGRSKLIFLQLYIRNSPFDKNNRLEKILALTREEVFDSYKTNDYEKLQRKPSPCILFKDFHSCQRIVNTFNRRPTHSRTPSNILIPINLCICPKYLK